MGKLGFVEAHMCINTFDVLTIFIHILFLFIFKSIVLNLSIHHNFIHVLCTYFTEFHTIISLNFMTHIVTV